VIVPTRRRGEVLRRLLHELVDQAVTGFETVVVFDGADPEVLDIADA
jgi:glycosyltransferase involved in cell wall biosynthesis